MVAGAGILDFFTADLLKGRRLHVLGLIGHGSRRVRVLGAPEHPGDGPGGRGWQPRSDARHARHSSSGHLGRLPQPPWLTARGLPIDWRFATYTGTRACDFGKRGVKRQHGADHRNPSTC